MKYGLVVPDRLSTISGGYLYDRRLVDHLRAKGHEVAVFDDPSLSPDQLTDRLASWDGDLLFEDELHHQVLRRVNERLVGRVKWRRVAIVHHLRCHEGESPVRERLVDRPSERAFLRSVDAWLCNSQATKTAVQTLAGLNHPSLVCPPSTNLPRSVTAERNQMTRQLRLLFVGNIIPRKNLPILLRALSLVDARGLRNWKLTIVGSPVDPRETQRCQTLARNLGNRVVWRGPLGDRDLELAYAGHEVLAVPSSIEGFGMVYLEAMDRGLVPIGPNGGGAAEVIGQTGLLVEPGAVASLTEALVRLTDHAFREGLGRQAQVRARIFPDWEASFAPLTDFLATFRP